MYVGVEGAVINSEVLHVGGIAYYTVFATPENEKLRFKITASKTSRANLCFWCT